MDYNRIYTNIIVKAKSRLAAGYVEKHHIIPRCIGGTNDLNNLVNLTAKEHYMVHRLLTEIYPDSRKLKYAYWMMCTMKTSNQQRYVVSSRIYEYAKSLINTRSDETKQKISESLKRSYASGHRESRAGKTMPKSFGAAISKAKKGMVGTNKGIPMTDVQKQKIRSTLLGHVVTQSTREKISQTLLNKPMITCPICDKSSKGTSFKRYHFENCKLN